MARRRTFAIISHPDAGKTTLTEKILLYAGAVELAGAVKAKRSQRHATSDWMAMEQERGISITSTVLQFDYAGCQINLLDTPGHQDFSEDTYRTLMAVDSAVMVLDAAKGIEPQTRKLFDVCRMRHIPILTFVNKMDRPGREPFDLLDEIERDLSIDATPRNWPIGDGLTFQGVYDRETRQVLLFERTAHGKHRAPIQVRDLADPLLESLLGGDAVCQLREEVELLGIAGTLFDRERFLRGDVTPVFFGSALNNFGMEPFLQALRDLAPSPAPRPSSQGIVDPTDDSFSAFVFKIQANLDPLHRDRVAFLRVCSGKFEKDMMVHHARLGRKVRMTRPYRLFARDRELIEEAFPGDVIGVVKPGLFAIGDTLSSGDGLRFDAVPRFTPECFGLLRNRETSAYKRFHKGLDQLAEEGAIRVFYAVDSLQRDPILAAVGELQFDLVVARLRTEYDVNATVERLPYQTLRKVTVDPRTLPDVYWPRDSLLATDDAGELVALFTSEWSATYWAEKYPALGLDGT